MERDAENLRLLAIFHWIVAGMTALFSLFPVIHLFMGLAMVSGKLPGQKPDGFERMFGWFFVVFACGWILVGLSFAACLAIAGRCIARREYRTYCLVVGGIACACFPFGTALGVFTLMVLSKDSVREMFANAPPQARPTVT